MSGSGAIPTYNPMAAQNAQRPGYQVAQNFLQGQANGSNAFPGVGPLPAVVPVSVGIPAAPTPTTGTETTQPAFDAAAYWAKILEKLKTGGRFSAADFGNILSSQMGRPLPSWWGSLGTQAGGNIPTPTVTTPNAIAPNVSGGTPSTNLLAGLLSGTPNPNLPVPTMAPTTNYPIQSGSLWNLIRSYNNG